MGLLLINALVKRDCRYHSFIGIIFADDSVKVVIDIVFVIVAFVITCYYHHYDLYFEKERKEWEICRNVLINSGLISTVLLSFYTVGYFINFRGKHECNLNKYNIFKQKTVEMESYHRKQHTIGLKMHTGEIW